MNLFDEMTKNGVVPTQFTLVPALQSCGYTKDIEFLKKIHSVTNERSLKDDAVISSLIGAYGECGDLATAQSLYEKATKSIFVEIGMMRAFNGVGKPREALEMLAQQPTKAFLNQALVKVALQSCAQFGDLEHSNRILEVIRSSGNRNYENSSFIMKTMIDMYGKCGDADEAEALFKKFPEKSKGMYKQMILAYDGLGMHDKVIPLFKQMERNHIPTDDAVESVALTACAEAGDLEMGKEIHAKVMKHYGDKPLRTRLSMRI